MFDDLLAANRTYRERFHDSGIRGKAAKGLGVLTCIDSRVDPLAMLGLNAGDAKILRNAGARVTPDALRSLVLATNLLDVTRICIVHHTDCAVGGHSEEELRSAVESAAGAPATEWTFLGTTDPAETMRADIELVRSCPLIPPTVQVGGFIFDVHTGEVRPVVD